MSRAAPHADAVRQVGLARPRRRPPGRSLRQRVGTDRPELVLPCPPKRRTVGLSCQPCLMAHPVMFIDDDPGLAELRAIALGLPGAEEKVSHGRPTFRAGKIFAAFGRSEKLSPGNHRQVPSALIFTPDPVDLPAINLDDPDVDWTEIAELVDASYRLIAPKRLLAELDGRAQPF